MHAAEQAREAEQGADIRCGDTQPLRDFENRADDRIEFYRAPDVNVLQHRTAERAEPGGDRVAVFGGLIDAASEPGPDRRRLAHRR